MNIKKAKKVDQKSFSAYVPDEVNEIPTIIISTCLLTATAILCRGLQSDFYAPFLYFGHIKRQNTLEKLFLEGTCEGRRGRGRPRRRWTQDIGEWMGVSTVEAGRQALERGEFRQAVREATSIKDPP